MDQYALRRFPSVPTRRTVSQQDEHFQFGCVFHCVTQKSQSAYLRCKTLPSPPLRKPASHSGLLLYKTKCLQLESPLQTGLHVSPCAGSLEQRQPLFHSPSAQGQTRQRHSCGQDRRALQPANALAVKCTQMEAVGSSIHQAFHHNIPPQLKTLANLKKSTWGQTPRVLLSCVPGASDREN